MIINCPVYLEVDERFTPEEGREFTLALRQYLVSEIVKDTKGAFQVKHTKDGKLYTIKVLTESEAIQRFGKSLNKVKSPATLPSGGTTKTV
jgi:Cu/Ag efflux pump CusA